MNDIFSLVFYLACFILSACILSVGVKKSSRLIVSLALAIPILVIGLRVNVGTDYESYVSIYDNYTSTGMPILPGEENIGSIETGFLWLMDAASLFSNSSWSLLLLAAILTIGFAYLAISRLSPKNIPIAFLLYLLVLSPFAMNGVRQGIAVSIVFFSYSYIIRGKPLKYVLTILFAALFHTSALALLPLYLLRFITIKKHTDESLTLLLSVLVAGSFALLIPLALSLISSIPALSMYVRYVGFEAGVAWGPIAITAILATAVVATYLRLTNKLPTMQLAAILLFLELAALLLGGVSAAIARMAYYLSIGGLVYLSNISIIFSKDTGRIVQFIAVVYGVFYFTYFYFINGYSDIFPYNSVWSNV